MEPMYLTIRQKETGLHIKRLLQEQGYTVKDVQNVMGFENPQAVYKWISGKSLPSLDNLVILSRFLHTSMENILVIDGDIVHFKDCRFNVTIHGSGKGEVAVCGLWDACRRLCDRTAIVESVRQAVFIRLRYGAGRKLPSFTSPAP